MVSVIFWSIFIKHFHLGWINLLIPFNFLLLPDDWIRTPTGVVSYHQSLSFEFPIKDKLIVYNLCSNVL